VVLRVYPDHPVNEKKEYIKKKYLFLIILFQGRDGYSNLKSAFFVALNKTYALQDNSAIIIWDDVILNRNYNLNNNTGIYYAPINGLYEFSLTVCVPANHIVCFI